MKNRGSFFFDNNHIVYVNDSEIVDRFSNNFPFDDMYGKIINHLKSKGYTTGENEQLKKEYPVLSKSHYYAEINNIEILFHKYPKGFEIEVGHKRNRMTCSAFWPHWNENYSKLSYLENKRIELVIKHIRDFVFKRFGGAFTERLPKPKDPIEEIFYNEARNTHIHGGAQSFDEIKEYCEKHEKARDDKDASGEILECGQTKYVYSYRHNYALCQVVVYHHINNMWWGIGGGNKLNNASWDYFDLSEDTPLKDPRRMISKVKDHLKEAEKEMNYEKCIHLRNEMSRWIKIKETFIDSKRIHNANQN